MSYYQGCFRWCKKWCNVVSVVLFFSKCQLDYNIPKMQKFPGAYTMNEANEEIFDVVDENGIPIGSTVTRTSAHAEGIRHRTVHIWVIRNHNGRNEALLQKRALTKDSYPGYYDTSSAGHIQAGDAPLDSALRELREELGIPAQKSDLSFAGTISIQSENIFHGHPFKDNEIAFVYIYKKSVDINSLVIQKEELDRVDWFDIETVYQACLPPRDSRFCVPLPSISLLRSYVSISNNP